MVLQRRLDYGFSGYQVPPTPRAPRSARRRSSFRKKIDGNQMCAFDLLATVAGKLLLEGEHSPSSIDSLTGKEQCTVLKDSVRKEQQGEENTLKVISCDQESRDRTSLISELEIRNFANKVEVASSGCGGVSFCCKLEDENKRIKIEPPIDGKVSISANANMCSSEDPVLWDRNPPALVGSDNSRNPQDDVKLVIRDDDENSSWCSQPSTVNKAFKPPPRIGDRRIRKILASKYWKVTPKLNGKEHFNTNAETKPVFRNRKNCFKRQRSLRDYPFKKRKFYDCSSVSNSDGGISCEGVPISLGNGDASGLCATTHGATGISAFRADQRASFQSSDSHVKLKIKSFRVPELFIEIPESATVGSLKRTVMDAVTAILSGGLRVGVLLQGKKIRDDNKTLLQTGISHDNKMDALGFTLEPNPLQAPPPLCPEERSFLLPCETPQPLTRYPIAPSVVQQGASDTSADHLSTNLGNLIESDHDSAPSPADMSMDKSVMDSRALVGVPAMNVEALAVVPVQKSRRPDVGQRRIRRPFSVSEVEALVQAVEKLGTGRWRDVKLRAFDSAKQRTYVDLKDKWKTLVHTARISPQQRRGEPVPQELLDRVLTAHAYWSKQQLKH